MSSMAGCNQVKNIIAQQRKSERGEHYIDDEEISQANRYFSVSLLQQHHRPLPAAAADLVESIKKTRAST